jgi:phosphoglycerate dehydrogenase-like enzyme
MTETNLPEVLAETDVLILALALTEETDGLVGAVELAYLPAHAWLVNVARGRHVDTDALTIALQERQIGGAVLDVTEPEPLPWNHPLRQLDNCLVTPHTACTPEIARPRLLERIYDNVQRFVAGRELIGVVDTRAGY